MMSSINQIRPTRSRRKKLIPTGLMDGITLLFLGHYVIMVLSVSSIFIRISYALLPLWLFFALTSEGSPKFWKAITNSKGVFIGLCGYSAWLFGEFIIGRCPDSRGLWNWPILTAFPVYMLSCYYGSCQPDRFWRILKILLAMIGVQAAFSLSFLIAGTWSPRIVMHGLQYYGIAGGKSFISEAARHGIGGYDLYLNAAVIASVVTGFSFGMRNSGLKRMFWPLALVFIVLANILSTFTASALVSILGSTTVLIYAMTMNKVKMSSAIITIIIAGIALFLIFDKIVHTSNYQFTFNKASMIFESVEDGGIRSETSGRGEMLFDSWDAFKMQPFVGNGPQGEIASVNGTSIGGGHSAWLNTLVQYGLFGGTLYFVMIISVGLQIWKTIKLRQGDLLAISFMVAYVSFLIYGIINTVMMDFVFFFVLYGGALALKRKSPEKKKANKAANSKKFQFIVNQVPYNPSL